ncbi:MAG: type II toxin-antitoxin system VapC family toxin [Cyanobacteria bacterium]|nr:type II toxin-antitoxin system VapC family toxin [Cyanobacteriota bacterium]
MIFIDSNVPMYLVGAPSPFKQQAEELLEAAVTSGERLVTSAEVLQEILHRYVSINRREAIAAAFDTLLAVVDEVVAVEEEDVGRARDLVLGTRTLSSRDAVHVAVMVRQGINRIMSFDRGFDRVPGIARIGR